MKRCSGNCKDCGDFAKSVTDEAIGTLFFQKGDSVDFSKKTDDCPEDYQTLISARKRRLVEDGMPSETAEMLAQFEVLGLERKDKPTTPLDPKVTEEILNTGDKEQIWRLFRNAKTRGEL